ncbi:hypothetical protein JB92DRAFT_3103136 [Gautieria morchelliformis]|nr:hypothetical protein JB92DRAFT_3103136 [Gautieria morchelliformis]
MVLVWPSHRVRCASIRAVRTYEDRYLCSGVMRGPSSSAPYDPNDVPALEEPVDKTLTPSQMQKVAFVDLIPCREAQWSPSLLPFSEGLLCNPPLSRVQPCGPSAKTSSEPDGRVQQLVRLHPPRYDLTSQPAGSRQSPHDATLTVVPPRPRNSSAARASRNHAKLTVAWTTEHGNMWATENIPPAPEDCGKAAPPATRTPGDILYSGTDRSIRRTLPSWLLQSRYSLGNGLWTFYCHFRRPFVAVLANPHPWDPAAALTICLTEVIPAKVVDVCLRGAVGVCGVVLVQPRGSSSKDHRPRALNITVANSGMCQGTLSPTESSLIEICACKVCNPNSIESYLPNPHHHYTYHDYNRQPVANKAAAAFKPGQQKGAMNRAMDKVMVMVSTAKLGDPFCDAVAGLY